MKINMDGAVVVLYNPQANDYKNILTYNGKLDYIYLIDNSANSHYDEISDILPIDGNSVIYEHHPENLGLCKGMNVGIKKLKEKGCSWAFTMNSDSYFINNVPEIFQQYVTNNDCSEIAIIAPLYSFDRHKTKTYKGTREINRAMMSGNYVNIDIFEKLGGFLEVLFIDGLDNEYCIRCREHGYRIIECGEALMEHMPCHTIKKMILGKQIMYGYDSPKRYYGHARALAFIVKRHKTLYEAGFYLYKLFKILFLFDNKKEYISQFVEGTKDGIKAERVDRNSRKSTK